MDNETKKLLSKATILKETELILPYSGIKVKVSAVHCNRHRQDIEYLVNNVWFIKDKNNSAILEAYFNKIKESLNIT